MKKLEEVAKSSDENALRNKSIKSEQKGAETLPDSPMSHFVDVLEWNPVVQSQDRKGYKAGKDLKNRSLDFKNAQKDVAGKKRTGSNMKGLRHSIVAESTPAPLTQVPVP